MKTNSWI